MSVRPPAVQHAVCCQWRQWRQSAAGSSQEIRFAASLLHLLEIWDFCRCYLWYFNARLPWC